MPLTRRLVLIAAPVFAVSTVGLVLAVVFQCPNKFDGYLPRVAFVAPGVVGVVLCLVLLLSGVAESIDGRGRGYDLRA